MKNLSKPQFDHISQPLKLDFDLQVFVDIQILPGLKQIGGLRVILEKPLGDQSLNCPSRVF